jgi:hypothetical protein
MASLTVAWSMAQYHNARREDEDDCADPDENGGPLLGNVWFVRMCGQRSRRFHDRINRTVNIRFLCPVF